MFRRILVVLALLGVSGCCCPRSNRCDPCPKPCDGPPQPQPPPTPPPTNPPPTSPPDGGGDTNCATWNTDIVSSGFTRPQVLSDIQARADAPGSGCTAQQRSQIATRISTYLGAKNCNGSITSPSTGDCAPSGQPNAGCFAAAHAAAISKDWATCISKLQQGH